MMEASINTIIQGELAGIAAEEGVTLLYACESGSRAWGFASSDSDYDVRFLYAHPRDWYLTIEEKRDVIERPISDQLDISGWDIRKALKLLRKSNPPLLEWLSSPIIYQQQPAVVARLREVVALYYSPRSSLYHYLHMAEGNMRSHLQGDVVWVKKYFYVLRPLLACRWIERGLGPVPMEFSRLVEAVVDDAPLSAAIDELLARKRAGQELDRGPRIAPISDFIEAEILRLRNLPVADHRPAGTEPLDELFRWVIGRGWDAA